MRLALLIFGSMVCVLWAPLARAERLVDAWDPAYGAKPPTAVYREDGELRGGPLRLDADFLAAAARQRAARSPNAAPGDVVQVGEILVVQGDEEILEIEGARLALRWPMTTLSRRVIEKVGDRFHAITLWTTFNDRSNTAEAYEQTIKIDVQGLGTGLRDTSRMYGSDGVLRSIVNMKQVGMRAGATRDTWDGAMPIWGQEIGHRWMMFMKFIDRRTGRPSDALLGRGCSHYNRFVDTQASVQDGFAWRDNGDGTFTVTGQNQRFGNLDLYGMGLLLPEELPSFFLIDEIPGYKHPRCQDYESTRKPLEATLRGKRVDISIEDLLEANGPRVPAADERLGGQHQDYFREAEVVVTQPGETVDSPNVRRLVENLERARLWWEDWMRGATDNRMAVCTKLSADCGDARSDVIDVKLNAAKRAPAAGVQALEIALDNGGQRAATNVKASVEVKNEALGIALPMTRDVGTMAPGAKRSVSFDVDLRRVPCGTEVAVKASSQSDFHKSRLRATFLVGTEARLTDGFEEDNGWKVNPDGDDTSTGAVWERGKPEKDEISGEPVQPDGAHGGVAAWVTGAKAGARASLVSQGRATLESPPIDASSLREPRLRYWVAFAGVRATSTGVIEPSPESRLIVLARGSAPASDGGAAAGASDWTEIDRLEDRNTKTWIQRTVVIPPALVGTGTLRIRFVAEDKNPSAGGVEAAIDDVEVTSNLLACSDPAPASSGDGGRNANADSSGCDCSLGRRPAPSHFVLAVAVVMGLARVRRRLKY